MNYSFNYVTFYTDWLNERMTSLSVSEVLSGDHKDFGKTFHDLCEHDKYGGTLVKKMHPMPKLTKKYPTQQSGILDWYEALSTFDSPEDESSIVTDFI